MLYVATVVGIEFRVSAIRLLIQRRMFVVRINHCLHTLCIDIKGVRVKDAPSMMSTLSAF